MIRHMIRLVWNRKRANALLVAEIAISFVVLFAVTLFASFYAYNYGRPLGFDARDVWYVSVDVKQEGDDTWDAPTVEKMRQLELAVADMPEVESVAGALNVPYTFSYSTGQLPANGTKLDYSRSEVTDAYAGVMRLDLTRGRWFGPDDDAAAVAPAVINERLARALFGDEDPVGRTFGDDSDDTSRLRVVGVVSEYRKDGEFSGGDNVVFERANLADPARRPPHNLMLRARPGTGAEFEQRLVGVLQNTAKDWSFEAKPVADLRAEWIRLALAPLVVVGLVAGFLLIMVGLGLTGVLWQNVTRRTREVGLRRVQGATAFDVCAQFLGELLVVATFGLAVGIAVVVQAPLLGLTGPIGPGVYASSVAISAALVYLLTTACGLYPSWLATRVAPVEALRYE